MHHAINEYQLTFDVQRFLWPAYYICDPLRENLALRANIEFEIEAILSVKVVSQLNSDYCTNVSQGALDFIGLNYEARLCYYNDDISSNSQAGL